MSTRMSVPTKIVDMMLSDKGLGKSTWQEQHPEAYKDLFDYRQDFIQQVRGILEDELYKIQQRLR